MSGPRVSERIKEAPVVALRGVLAGIGQLLVVTDRLRNKTAAEQPEPAGAETAGTASSGTETATAKTVGDAAVAEDAAVPENAAAQAEAPAAAREAKTAEPPVKQAKPPVKAAAPKPAANVTEPEAHATGPEPVATESEPEPATASSPAAELPLAGYDDLTVNSLRARLRNLSTDQLSQLLSYEKEHQNRPQVTGMFERRLAKLADSASG